MRAHFGRRRTMPPAFIGVLFLPSGMSQGFVTIALGYVLAQHGVSVAIIAGLVGLRLLPETWSFLSGPLIDTTLDSARWYCLAVVALAICAVGFAFVPLRAPSTSVLAGLCLATGVVAVLSQSAVGAALALTTSNQVRGACAGWRQTGYLGGIGLGGGGGLWIATHAGGPRVAAVVLAVACLSCAWPFLIVQVPMATCGAGVVAGARSALGALWLLLRTRPGVLAIIAVTLPAGLGAASNLLPAVAADWRASADLVATVTGLLGGVATIPGCIAAGYLCDRFPRRTVFIWSALICAGGEAAMALAPHTPWMFAALGLLNCALTGLAYGSVTAVIYDRLGVVGAATVGGVLGSLCNLPLIVVTMLIGAVQVRHGSSAMLLVEAGLGAASVVIYALIVAAWRPRAEAPAPERAPGIA
jgi:PAT family beta-lactamase induction signal transducer AmpG